MEAPKSSIHKKKRSLTSRRRHPPPSKKKKPARCASIYDSSGQYVGDVCDYNWNQTKLPTRPEETLILNCLIDMAADVVETTKLNKDRLREDWDKIRTNQLPLMLLASNGDARRFVIEVHKWVRLYLAVPYEENSWSPLVLWDSQVSDVKCNCLCSTFFIILACAAVGFCPSEIVTSAVPDHIFLVYRRTHETFETTDSCVGTWELPTTSYPQWGLVKGIDRPIYHETAQAICAGYLVGAMAWSYHQYSETRSRVGKLSTAEFLSKYELLYGDMTAPDFVVNLIEDEPRLSPTTLDHYMGIVAQSVREKLVALTLSFSLINILHNWYRQWPLSKARGRPSKDYAPIHARWGQYIVQVLNRIVETHPAPNAPEWAASLPHYQQQAAMLSGINEAFKRGAKVVFARK
jgi:hypothetical protein